MNNNVPLRAMNVDMTHFAAVCTTRARARLVYKILSPGVTAVTVGVMQCITQL